MFAVTPHLARLDPNGALVTVLAIVDVDPHDGRRHEPDTALVIDREGGYMFAPLSRLRCVSTVLLPEGREEDAEHEHELSEPTVKVEGSRVVGTVRRCLVEGCDYSTIAPIGGASRA